MLIWQTSSVQPEQLQPLVAKVTGPAECLLRDDKKGSLILCERGSVPEGVQEMRGTTLFTGGSYGPEAGSWVFLVGVWTPEDWREEFCAWYKCEHGPILLECPEWQGFRFVQVPSTSGCQFYVLHRLSDRAALDSEHRKRSRRTPWFKRLATNEWFDEPFERVLSRRVTLK
jgi:hypothetical protein